MPRLTEIEEEDDSRALARPGHAHPARPPPTRSRRLARATGKLLLATGRAAWVAGTTALVLFVPLIIELDREQQALDLEAQQLGVLAGPGGAAPAAVGN